MTTPNLESVNTALASTTVKLLNGLETLTLQSVDAIKEQAPLVVKEILVFKSIEAIIFMLGSIVIGVFLITVFHKLHIWIKKVQDTYRDGDEGYMFCGILRFIFFCLKNGAFMVIILDVIEHLITLFKIWFASRLYLFEFFSQFIK